MAPRVPIAAPGGVLHEGRARGPHRWVLAAGRGGGALAHACELTSPRRLQLSGTAAGPPLGALVPCGERAVTRACKECPWLCKAPPSLPALAHALVHGDALARGWLCVQRGGGLPLFGRGVLHTPHLVCERRCTCTLPQTLVHREVLAFAHSPVAQCEEAHSPVLTVQGDTLARPPSPPLTRTRGCVCTLCSSVCLHTHLSSCDEPPFARPPVQAPPRCLFALSPFARPPVQASPTPPVHEGAFARPLHTSLCKEPPNP